MLSGSLLMPDSVDKTRNILSVVLEYQFDARHIHSFITLLVWQLCLQRKLPYTAENLFIYAQYELVFLCRKYMRNYADSRIDSFALLSADWSAHSSSASDAQLHQFLLINKLDSWSRYLLYLHLYEEMSVRDIANMLGYAKSSVHESLTNTLSILIEKEKQ